MPPSQQDPNQAHDTKASLSAGPGGVISVISVAMVYIFAFSFGVSLSPISWNVCAETSHLHINTKCCAVPICTQLLFQLVIAYVTPHLLASVGWATYLLHAGCCMASLLWVQLCVPETHGVKVGGPMDTLFGTPEESKRLVADWEESVEEVEETSETSETMSLLRSEHRLYLRVHGSDLTRVSCA